eukprot:scaffold139449_cov17-Cyclotella_meneghiniana.AAC.1
MLSARRVKSSVVAPTEEGQARVSTGWILSARRVKSSVVAPTEEGQVSDYVDLFILTIAAGLSQ